MAGWLRSSGTFLSATGSSAAWYPGSVASADIDFDVDERIGGGMKWSFTSLIRYSIRNVISFSNLPLRIVAYTGFIVSGMGALILFKAMADFFSGQSLAGFTTAIGVQVLICGMLLVAQGTISLYIANMYDEQKARPIYLVDDKLSTAKQVVLPTPRQAAPQDSSPTLQLEPPAPIRRN